MIVRHVKIDELLTRKRAGSVSHFASVRIDGVPVTLTLTPAEHDAFERIVVARTPLVLTIAEESAE